MDFSIIVQISMNFAGFFTGLPENIVIISMAAIKTAEVSDQIAKIRERTLLG